MTSRSDIIADVYQAWEKRWVDKTPADPRFAKDGSSQYPEGVVALSASDVAQAELHQQVQAALEAAGLEVF